MRSWGCRLMEKGRLDNQPRSHQNDRKRDQATSLQPSWKTWEEPSMCFHFYSFFRSSCMVGSLACLSTACIVLSCYSFSLLSRYGGPNSDPRVSSPVFHQ